MSILIFLLVLVALIVVHEFGHFVVAKWSGMRVDEFGLGYPPRALTLGTIGETVYTLNWLPFGGFVKIYGEDLEDKAAGHHNKRAFSARPKVLQALTLVAGIAMNLLFAYVLITATLLMHAPRALTPEEAAKAPDAAIVVASALPGSPAAEAGLLPGDTLVGAVRADGVSFTGSDAAAFTAFVASDTGSAPITLTVERAGAEEAVTLTPRAGISPSAPERLALGIGLAVVGTVDEPLVPALLDGARLTAQVTMETARALIHFFAGLFTFTADLSQVAGPVGIAGAVGSAAHDGAASLLTITALISINLALINLLPIPALDGGRLLFVLIEAITRRPIKPVIANAFNTAGFALLILLMLVVTAHDIFKIAT